MNMKQLKYVLALSEAGSFSKAADELDISQPSLSQYIKKLETDLGVSLFDRVKGDVRLTQAGRIYVETGKSIMNLEHKMDVQFSDLSQNKSGSIIIGTSPYRAAITMPAVAKAFKAMYPGMHLIVREATVSELSDNLSHGEYDFCLTLGPIEAPDIQSVSVAEEEILLAVPENYPEVRTTELEDRLFPAVNIRDLPEYAFVCLTGTQFMQRQLEKVTKESELTFTRAAEVKSIEAQIAMVREGIGAALVPSGIEKQNKDGRVRFYSIVQELPRRMVVLAWPSERRHSKAAETLKKIILQGI